MIKSVWQGEKKFVSVFIPFVVVTALGPITVFLGTFFVLCANECSALPWLTFLIAPVIISIFIVPFVIWLGVGSFRSSKNLKPPFNSIGKVAVLSSYFWLPAVLNAVLSFVIFSVQHAK